MKTDSLSERVRRICLAFGHVDAAGELAGEVTELEKQHAELLQALKEVCQEAGLHALHKAQALIASMEPPDDLA